MKILAVSDEKSKYYYDFYAPGKLDEFDLILSCGDLSKDYIEFLVSLSHCPVLYVRGNHDDRFATNPPEGCICIEDQIYEYNGLRILGLGGSFHYREGLNMYTEKQMEKRVRRLWWQLWKKKGFDILVTHAPAKGVNDGTDIAHQGFACFVYLLEKYAPKYFIHGHMHRSYSYNLPQISTYKKTTVVNAYEHCVIEV